MIQHIKLGHRSRSLGHQHKPSINFPEDMDNHCRPLCAFHQLKDADVALLQLVVVDELDPAAAVEASGVACVVVLDVPLLFPVWPEEQDLMGSPLKVLCCKFIVDCLHCEHKLGQLLLRKE